MKRLTQFIANADIREKLSRSADIDPRRLAELAADAEPSMSEVRALARALKVDPAELLGTDKQDQVDFLFRDTAAKSDPATVSKLSNRIAWSLDLLPDREVAGPWWLGQFDRRANDFETADRNANQFRRLFFDNDQVSPFFHLPSLTANTLGILVFLVRIAGIDGASAIFGGIPFVFLAEQFRPRMLFTLAHEIGHLIAHHEVGQAFAVVDFSAERPRKRKNALESYAHAFASALLMPSRGVAIALEQIRGLGKRGGEPIGDIELLLLSRIFGVSFYAAARRCEDLSLLPRGGAASLDHAIRKEFGSPEKRAESLNLPPRPEIRFPRVPEPLLASVIDRVRAGEISIGKASEVLGFSISELIDANLPSIH
jgi:Zn-dependent peptidase ImmA (M78 family)